MNILENGVVRGRAYRLDGGENFMVLAMGDGDSKFEYTFSCFESFILYLNSVFMELDR